MTEYRFKYNEVNHGYWGILAIGISYFLEILWLKYLLIFFGIILVIDEIIQIILKRQHGGFIHNIYIMSLYKIPLIKKFNIWVDKILGKK